MKKKSADLLAKLFISLNNEIVDVLKKNNGKIEITERTVEAIFVSEIDGSLYTKNILRIWFNGNANCVSFETDEGFIHELSEVGFDTIILLTEYLEEYH